MSRQLRGLCPKGLGYAQIPREEEHRATKPMYRAPGATTWQEISWDEAIERAARALKKARDENWIDTEQIGGESVKVNRTDAIGLIGGLQVNNEECYQLTKIFRSLGAMINPWCDLKNTKLAWVEGSNIAECHLKGLKNLMKAKKNGLKMMHVDVRFTRTYKIADYFIQIRPDTDIAFLGAIINYVIQNHKYDEQYIRLHTNAYMLIDPNFGFDDGIFSGYDEQTRKYDMTTWRYQVDANGKPLRSADLFAPNTVMSILKMPGGGIDAMRGQPNVQASTDYGIMFQYFPGYLP